MIPIPIGQFGRHSGIPSKLNDVRLFGSNGRQYAELELICRFSRVSGKGSSHASNEPKMLDLFRSLGHFNGPAKATFNDRKFVDTIERSREVDMQIG